MVCGYWCYILFLLAATCCLHYQTSNCQRNFLCQRDKNKYGATAMAAAIRWALSDCKWSADIHWPLKVPLNNIWKHIGFICEPWKHAYKDIRFIRQPSKSLKITYFSNIGKTYFFLLNCGTASLAGWNWHRSFYTQRLLHREVVIQTGFYTQKLLHSQREVFSQRTLTHRSFYTEKSVHLGDLAHKRVYAEELLHTETFTQRSDYTESFYTQTRLHTEAFTQRSLYTGAFAHKGHYTQKLLHTERCYIKKSLHREL